MEDTEKYFRQKLSMLWKETNNLEKSIFSKIDFTIICSPLENVQLLSETFSVSSIFF